MWTFIGIVIAVALVAWAVLASARAVGWAETWGSIGFVIKVMATLLGIIAAIIAGIVLVTMIVKNASPAEAWRILGSS